MLIYTTIQHAFRKEHKLTCNEYVLVDMVYALSTSTLSKFPGWCYMKRESMAEELGLSKQSIINLIEKMVDSGFLIKEPERKFLKTTIKWEGTRFTNGKESLPEVMKVDFIGKEGLPEVGKESLPYNNIINKNTEDKNKRSIGFEFFWNLYDKKEGEKDCRKEWQKLTLEDQTLIIKDVPAYIENLVDRKYQKTPLKYLRGEHWKDDRGSTQAKLYPTSTHVRKSLNEKYS